MSDHHDHDHPHDPAHPGHRPPAAAAGPGEGSAAPDPDSDAATQALADALRRSFAILRVVMGLLIAAFLLSNLHTVGPEERGVILRLGRPVGQGEGILLQPGLHLAWPYPFDEFRTIPISRLLQVSSTVGWYYVDAATRAAGQAEDRFSASLKPVRDGYTLTGDANIVHVEASFSYRITEPGQYIFAFENAPALLTNALNNAIHYASCQSRVDDLLKAGVAGFKDRVRDRLATLIQEQHLGVTVDTLNVNIEVPRQVKDDFDRVLATSTRVEADKNNAQAEADRVVKDAAATAGSIVVSARSERDNEVKRIRDEARSFEDRLNGYRKAPELFRRRYLSELMQRVSPVVDQKIHVPSTTPDGHGWKFRLLLNREEQVPNVAPAPAPSGDKH